MRFINHVRPYFQRLALDMSPEREKKLEAFFEKMVADPLYPSVSKIFEPEEIATKHLLDSLIPLTFEFPCWKKEGTILDLGTGGGFPSIPLSIMFPKRTVFAVDSKGKAVDFVKRMKEVADLPNLEPLLARAEELGHQKEFRGKIDLVVCRALASIRVLLEYCLPLVKVGGYALFYKGPKLEEELKEATNAQKLLGVKFEDISIHELEPPMLPFSRGYVLVAKRRETPQTYPRRNGVPSSHPL